MKIVLIGSVYPYKGGIAHYISLLCRALREKHDVDMVSYCMQYPKLLFNAFKMADLSKGKARKQIGLEIGKPMLLFFGFVRDLFGMALNTKKLKTA